MMPNVWAHIQFGREVLALVRAESLWSFLSGKPPSSSAAKGRIFYFTTVIYLGKVATPI